MSLSGLPPPSAGLITHNCPVSPDHADDCRFLRLIIKKLKCHACRPYTQTRSLVQVPGTRVTDTGRPSFPAACSDSHMINQWPISRMTFFHHNSNSMNCLFAVSPFLVNTSLQIFAHATTAQLSCHTQNLVAVIWSTFGSQQNNLPL